jgi:ribose/xylose/arabinose/galactoside ABC-type transport system permease subunit
MSILKTLVLSAAAVALSATASYAANIYVVGGKADDPFWSIVKRGMGFIFNAIVSIVVGGVLLTGGFRSILGIVFGTLTFAVVSQGIYFTNIDRNWSNLIIGVTLLFAVLMNNTFRKMAVNYTGAKKRN